MLGKAWATFVGIRKDRRRRSSARGLLSIATSRAAERLMHVYRPADCPQVGNPGGSSPQARMFVSAHVRLWTPRCFSIISGIDAVTRHAVAISLAQTTSGWRLRRGNPRCPGMIGRKPVIDCHPSGPSSSRTGPSSHPRLYLDPLLLRRLYLGPLRPPPERRLRLQIRISKSSRLETRRAIRQGSSQDSGQGSSKISRGATMRARRRRRRRRRARP